MAYQQITGAETGDFSEANATSGTVSVQSTTKRTGSYAYRLNPTAGGGYIEFNGFAANGKMASFGASQWATFYIRFASLPGASAELGRFHELTGSGNMVARLFVDASGNLTIQGNGVASGTVATLSANTWYRIDFRAANAGTCGVAVDGGAETTVTGAAQVVNFFAVGNTGGVDTYDLFVDDIAVNNAGYPGNGFVTCLRPIGAGALGEWGNGTGATFAEVDDAAPGHDSDTTYIGASATEDNQDSTFDMTSSSTAGITGVIKSVKSSAVVRTDSTAGTSAIFLKTIANGTNEATAAEATTTYTLWGKLFDADVGAAPWTTTVLDTLEVGVGANTIAQAQRCTAIYACVWWSPLNLSSLSGTAGALTGTIARLTNKPLTGVMGALTGALAKLTNKALSGVAGGITGAITRLTNKALNGINGALTGILQTVYIPSGTLYFQNVAGAISTLTGAIALQTNKALSGATAAITGTVSMLTSKALSGTMGALTGIVNKLTKISLSGTVGATAGSLVKKTLKSLTGSVSTLSGTLARFTSKSLHGIAGSLTGALSTLRFVSISLSGTMGTLTGSLTRSTFKSVVGIVGLTGTINKLISKSFSGSTGTISGIVTPVIPTIARVIMKAGRAIRAYIPGGTRRI